MNNVDTHGLFTQFEQMLKPGESLNFRVERTDSGLHVTVNPELAKPDDDLPEEALKFRAHLAQPLFIQSNGEELDTQFNAMLGGYHHARNGVRNAYDDLIASLNEGANVIADAAHKNKTSPKSGCSTAKKPSASNGNSDSTDSVLSEDGVPDSL